MMMECPFFMTSLCRYIPDRIESWNSMWKEMGKEVINDPYECCVPEVVYINLEGQMTMYEYKFSNDVSYSLDMTLAYRKDSIMSGMVFDSVY